MLLRTHGQVVTLRSTVFEEYDPETGVIDEPTISNELRVGIFESFKTTDSRFRGTITQEDDKLLLIDAVGSVPKTEDFMLVDGVEYQIFGVDAINPAGTPVLYYLHLRVV